MKNYPYATTLSPPASLAICPGDEIKIERSDKQVFAYRVVAIDQKPLEQVDINTLLHPITPRKEGLNLITCSGLYDKTRKTYNDRAWYMPNALVDSFHGCGTIELSIISPM